MAFLFSAFDTMSSHTLARFWLCASSTTVVAVRSTISSRPTTYRSAYVSPSLNTATIGLPVTEPVSQMLMFSKKGLVESSKDEKIEDVESDSDLQE